MWSDGCCSVAGRGDCLGVVMSWGTVWWCPLVLVFAFVRGGGLGEGVVGEVALGVL